jgi:3-oxoacyl-[acyl-carrier protein] reductase
MNDNSPKIAVVTGGSRGIGQCIVQSLANMGMHVFFNYASQDDRESQNTCAMVQKNGGTCLGIRADISDQDDCHAFFKAVLQQASGIHVLVNNAGIRKDGLLAMMPQSNWDDVIAINLRGAFLCTKAALKPMIRQRWGRIINISSVVGITGNAGQSNYAASKAGLIGFTKSIAQEVASRQITANVVAPGFVQTQMTEKMDNAQHQKIINRIPMKRMGDPEDVAALVRFLVSDHAGYITGQVIQVCGGLVM